MKKILIEKSYLCYFIVYLEYTVSVDYIKVSDKAHKPLHLTSGSVGSDLFSAKKYTLYPNQLMLVDVDLHMNIPRGYCGLVSSRSSLALKGIQTHVGSIDNDYEGLVRLF